MNYKDILAMASAYKQVAEKKTLDPVDAKELKGKHKDRKDKDIDNDGDVDKSDEYLHNRRKAVSASIKGKKKGTEVETEVQEAGGHSSWNVTFDHPDHKPVTVKGRNTAEAIKKAEKKATAAAGGKHLASYKNITKESVELDELSKKTLGSYVKKAKTDVAGQAYQLGAKDPLKPKASWSKALGREKHIDKAVDRLTKESFDLSDFTVEELEDFMMTEDFAQLDELSKKTLGSYVKKATRDISDRSASAAMDLVTKNTGAVGKKVNKNFSREKGIGKATDRLTKEAKDHGNMNNGSPRGEGLSPSAKKELERTTPMNPATDELAVNNLNFKTFKAMGKKAPKRTGDNDAGDKTMPKNDGK